MKYLITVSLLVFLVYFAWPSKQPQSQVNNVVTAETLGEKQKDLSVNDTPDAIPERNIEREQASVETPQVDYGTAEEPIQESLIDTDEVEDLLDDDSFTDEDRRIIGGLAEDINTALLDTNVISKDEDVGDAEHLSNDEIDEAISDADDDEDGLDSLDEP